MEDNVETLQVPPQQISSHMGRFRTNLKSGIESFSTRLFIIILGALSFTMAIQWQSVINETIHYYFEAPDENDKKMRLRYNFYVAISLTMITFFLVFISTKMHQGQGIDLGGMVNYYTPKF